jgi:hypothetical protein
VKSIGGITYDDIDGNFVEIAVTNADDRDDPLVLFVFSLKKVTRLEC